MNSTVCKATEYEWDPLDEACRSEPQVKRRAQRAMSRSCHGEYLGAVARGTTAGKGPVNKAR